MFYETGESVTVRGNTGNLSRSGFGFTFVGWNTESDGSGIHYDENDNYVMGNENVVLYAELQASGLSVGDTGPGGGVIFFDKGNYLDGWRYLKAATSDQGTDNVWGGLETDIGGDDSGSAPELTGIGSGKANTEVIVTVFGEAEPYEGRTDYAAKLCYELNLGGYDDWFLPSRDELAEMYLQRTVIGGFSDSDEYWSSSEYNSDSGWDVDFGVNGFQLRRNKARWYRVRAARRF